MGHIQEVTAPLRTGTFVYLTHSYVYSHCYYISTVAERAKLLRIYGPDLFQEEARAVEGMFRMLNYQQGIDMSQLTSEIGALRDEDTEEDDHLSHSEFHAMAREVGEEGTHSTGNGGSNAGTGNNDVSDIYLPPFVRKALEEMLSAPDKESKSFVAHLTKEKPKQFDIYVRSASVKRSSS